MGVSMLVFMSDRFPIASRDQCSTLETAGDSTSLTQEEAVFGFGKKKPTKSGSDSKNDRYVEKKDEEAAWGFVGSAKEESDRQARRGGR
jgi:hypothetical protein